MDVAEALQFIWKNLLSIVAILGIFVEIAPIKVNPISALLNLLFKPIRKEMEDMKKSINKNIDSVKEELKNDMNILQEKQAMQDDTIQELITNQEMNEISRIRWEIIEFANSINNGQLHMRDEYRHIKDQSKRYHTLIQKYDLENGIIDEEMEKINTHYDENVNNSSIYF